MHALREHFDRDADLTEELGRLARLFNASTLVVLRRLHDAKFMSFKAFRGSRWDREALPGTAKAASSRTPPCLPAGSGRATRRRSERVER